MTKTIKALGPQIFIMGDIDGDLPDKKEHKYVNTHKQKNVPGDGKLDPSTVKPNSIEMEVGRVDLADMPTFGNNETELLRQYLNKDWTGMEWSKYGGNQAGVTVKTIQDQAVLSENNRYNRHNRCDGYSC